MAIDAPLLKSLREETGAPIVRAKRVLEETNGDVKKAKKILLKEGFEKMVFDYINYSNTYFLF